MTTGLKIAIGATIGTGAIGGTAGIVHVLTQPKNLKEDLEKSGTVFLNTKQVINNADDATWKILATKHSGNSLANGITKIAGLTINNHTGNDPHPGIKQLKEECEKLFKKTKKDTGYEQSKTDATNWCTKKQISGS